jgi:hypothetical protein
MRRSTVLSLPLQLVFLGSQKRQWLYLSWLPWGTDMIGFICVVSLRVGTTLCLVLIPETVFWVGFAGGFTVSFMDRFVYCFTGFCGSFAGIFAMGGPGAVFTTLRFLRTYEWPQVLHHTRLERVARDKDTSLLDLLISNE